MIDLLVEVNSPFAPSRIRHLYADREDLKLAFPRASYPFLDEEWTSKFPLTAENSSLLFIHDGATIGHIALIVKEEEIYLCWVILLPEYRGKGISQRMVLQAEEFCRINYTHQDLHLHVNKANLRAKKLYKKLGYEVVRRFQEKIRMKKKLRQDVETLG